MIQNYQVNLFCYYYSRTLEKIKQKEKLLLYLETIKINEKWSKPSYRCGLFHYRKLKEEEYPFQMIIDDLQASLIFNHRYPPDQLAQRKIDHINQLLQNVSHLINKNNDNNDNNK